MFNSRIFLESCSYFVGVEDELLLICIDKEKINAEVKYEDGDNCGREYPHVYGLINNNAVINVLSFLKNEDGTYKKNPEFAHIEER